MFSSILFSVGFLGFVLGENCPTNSLSLENNDTICYSFHSRLSKFAQAQIHCSSFGGQLVSLKNEYTNVYITNYAKLIFDDIIFFWSGGNKLKNPAEFEWGNGEKVEYQRFRDAQDKTNGSCISADIKQGYWKAENCFAELSFVCEFLAGKNITPIDPDSLDLDGNSENDTTDGIPVTLLPGPITTVTPVQGGGTTQTNVVVQTTTTAPAPPVTQGFHETPFTPPVITTATILPLNPVTQATTAPVPTCPTDWVMFENSCYKVNPKKNYTDAEADCESQGGHLATIHSEKENAFVVELGQNLENASCKWDEQMWIGFESRHNESFVWLDNSTTEYTNWGAGGDGHSEPNNYGKDDEECAEIIIGKGCESQSEIGQYVRYEQGKWNDYKCNKEMAYVCKKVAEASPVNTLPPMTQGPADGTTQTEAIRVPVTANAPEKPGTPTVKPVLPVPGCPPDWVNFKNRCYKAYPKRDFYAAEAVCKSEGAHLASIESEQENSFVVELGRKNREIITCEKENQLWIGFARLSNNEVAWIDNSTTDYINWALPFIITSEKCAYVALVDSSDKSCLQHMGKWDDCNCAKELQFICKKEAIMVDAVVPTVAQTRDESKMSTSLPKDACPSDWVKFENSCYKVNPKKNFTDAETDCENQGAHLASIHSQQENAFVTELGYKAEENVSCKWDEQMWIGFDGTKSDKFVWTDNSATDYTNWALPFIITSEKCAYVALVDSSDKSCLQHMGKWDDCNCAKELQFICKKEATMVDAVVPTVAQMRDESKISTSLPKDACPFDWVKFENSCYKVNPKKNYTEAEEDCESQGAHLASIHSEQENAFVVELGYKAEENVSCKWDEQMWIGFDGTKSDKFVWTDNSATDYTNWAKKGSLLEPNNYLSNEKCTQTVIGKDCDKSGDLHFNVYEHGSWNDYYCITEMIYVCKKNAVV